MVSNHRVELKGNINKAMKTITPPMAFATILP